MHLNLRFSRHFNLHTSGTQVQVINLLKRARKGGIDEDPFLALLLEECPNEVDCLSCMSDLHPRISSRELDCSSPYTSEVSIPFCYRHLILLQASHSASGISFCFRHLILLSTLHVSLCYSVPGSYACLHIVQYPSGQISFKLYDWDLGYFARNLRQQVQIFILSLVVQF
jgi:hypothetical protein